MQSSWSYYRQEFETFLTEKYLQERVGGSIVVTKARAEELKPIIAKGFMQRGHNPHAHDTTPLGKCNQAAVVKDFFDIIYQSHYKDTGCSGAKITLAKVRLSDPP